MPFVSLWDEPPKPVIKKPEVKPIIKKDIVEEVKKIEAKPQPTTTKRHKYIITAGTNRRGRPIYLAGYDDCEDWLLSAVPYATTKTHCYRLIDSAKAAYKNKELQFGKKVDIPDFQIIEVQ